MNKQLAVEKKYSDTSANEDNQFVPESHSLAEIFVSRNVMLSGVSLLAVSNVNNPVGLVGLPYVMSARFFVTHIQTEMARPFMFAALC